MEIHVRTLAFILVSVLGSVSLPFLVEGLPASSGNGSAPLTSLPMPTPVPVQGLSAQARDLAAALVVTVAPTPLPTATPPSLTASVRTDGRPLNLRSGPGLEFTVLGSAANGTALTVTGVSADGQWLEVAIPDWSRTLWVFAALTSIDGNGAGLPVGE